MHINVTNICSNNGGKIWLMDFINGDFIWGMGTSVGCIHLSKAIRPCCLSEPPAYLFLGNDLSLGAKRPQAICHHLWLVGEPTLETQLTKLLHTEMSSTITHVKDDNGIIYPRLTAGIRPHKSELSASQYLHYISNSITDTCKYILLASKAWSLIATRNRMNTPNVRVQHWYLSF